MATPINRFVFCVLLLSEVIASVSVVRADIFQWEYLDPANPSLGRQQSTILAPDGAGASAMPSAVLTGRDLTKAYLIGANLSTFDSGYPYNPYPYPTSLGSANLTQADLTNANLTGFVGFDGEGDFYFEGANLTSAILRQANLTGADFWLATLNDADLSQANMSHASMRNATLVGATLIDADIRGADFGRGFVGVPFGDYLGGITLPQLYSTASYQANDLSGIGLFYNNLNGAFMAGQNLQNADFTAALLSNANFMEADARGADFQSASLSGANMSYANLANTDFTDAFLGDANFSAADARGGDFQFASLSGANMSYANLANADFAGVIVPDYDENGVSVGEHVRPGANLTGANLSGADARGANFQYTVLNGVNTTNLIQTNGHIAGLDLTAGMSLVIRDYDGNASAGPPTGPLPISVDQHLAMSGTGTLRLVFDDDTWDSTISFAPSISVTRGGTLELTYASDVSLVSQIGRTIDLFDWSGVAPTGTFNVSSPYTWNLSNLYTSGEVTLTAVPGVVLGDFSGNGVVDAADYVVWRDNYGRQSGAMSSSGDGDRDGDVDGNDFLVWQRQFGSSAPAASATATVPEPATVLLIVVAVVSIRRKGGHRRQ